MNETMLKKKLSTYTGEFMAALLLIQPLLDVLSYFMGQSGATAFTTALRTVLLFLVCLYGFIISDHKKAYAVMYGVVAGFWLLHALNCLRVGYADPVGDAAEYLKLVQFPLWTLSFITFFRKKEEMDSRIIGVLAADFVIILCVIGISYLASMPVYTYDYPERGMQIGILGWFGVANAQSAILCLLVPGLLLWAGRTGKLWLFSLASLGGFGLLYFTGTRLTYYGAVLIAAAFLVLMVIGRRRYLFAIPLVLVLVALVVFRGVSPMAERQGRTADSYAIYQEKTDEIMGEDKDFVYGGDEEMTPEIEEKIRRVYDEIYSQEGLYETTLLGDIIERFGTEAVMEQYHYDTRPETLYNGRTKKLTAMRMIWKEKDVLTKLVGFEYSEATLGGNIYDPENDVPSLLYYNGYLGAALYLGFWAYFILLALWRFIKGFPRLFTPEFAVPVMILVLGLGAAQLSGQVLRKPSVTVYLSVAAAMVYCGKFSSDPGKMRVYYDNSRVVSRKKI